MRVRFLQLAAVLGAALLAPASAAASGPSLLGNGGFEKPLVGGDVVEPAGSVLGSCRDEPPDAGGAARCWLVVNGRVDLIHDDFQTGGVSWAPFAGAQMVMLAPSRRGANTQGVIRQSDAVPAGTEFELRLAYAADPSTPAGSKAPLVAIVSVCTQSPVWCPDGYLQNVVAKSTGDPSAVGWRTLKLPVATAADETLIQVQIQTQAPGGHSAVTVASVVDNVRLNIVRPTAAVHGAYRDRTGDPQLAKLVLSQLS